ncbi:MAG: sugar phosphate isomerase/epimerase [Lentisphaerae bacterium]|jgi:sugar phosphate isomerase/epimerase|nr:sugar phosphate isomerase/epimerase [Lentisphaerota bacterium]
MYLTGFADEAATDLAGQIRATKELGWRNIESRNIDGVNIHDLTDEAFDKAFEQLAAADIQVNCFGSTIANWGKDIRKPFDVDLEQTDRAIKRMQRLNCKMIRVMSYAVIPDRAPQDQMANERFRRLREITERFLAAGIQPVHENCMNYGGMGWSYTLKLLENVPGLKLVFDTGNPVFTDDRTLPDADRKQSSWNFYLNVKEHIAYIHIKDGFVIDDKTTYTWPGEGTADVVCICKHLLASGYDGGISIEPHIGAVFHDPNVTSEDDRRFAVYVEYGRRMERILESIKPQA